MHDDNKNDSENLPVSLPAVDLPVSSEPRPFTPDQMVRCEECLRANGPTRVNCLYCGAALPFNETSATLQKPALRPLEKWELGYNNIILPSSANALTQIPEGGKAHGLTLSDDELSQIADLLKLTTADLTRILSMDLRLPLARASTMDEALLVQRRLSRLRIDTVIVPDVDLGAAGTPPFKVRAIELDPMNLIAYQSPETQGVTIAWCTLTLVVIGRLVVKRVELREQKTARAENLILDANEFFTDESAMEFYVAGEATPYRIAANSFDFSCLGEGKRFVAGENLLTLLNVFRSRVPHLKCDDSYKNVRKALEAVWPSQQQVEAGGWRRDRPGKYSIGSATEISNEQQFLRYSRLRHYFSVRLKEKDNEDA